MAWGLSDSDSWTQKMVGSPIIYGVYVSKLRSNECALTYAQRYALCIDIALLKFTPRDDT